MTRKDSINTYWPGIGPTLRLLAEAGIPILVHGGGSFAHPHIARYGVTRQGISLAKAGLRRLSSLIIEEAAEHGVYIYPIDAVIARDDEMLLSTLISVADAGFIPMVSGDVDPRGRIISGDELMVRIASLVKPRLALFLMDVNGVYVNGQLIREVPCQLDVSGASGVDVTGGISTKLSAARRIAAMGIPTYLCSARDLDSLKKVVSGGSGATCSRVIPC